jgi:hypothetical protein
MTQPDPAEFFRSVKVPPGMGCGRMLVDLLIERAEAGQATDPAEAAEITDRMNRLLVASHLEVLDALGRLSETLENLRSGNG